MTTIAYDGTTVAADTLGVDNWGLKSTVSKIHQLPNFIVAGAGNYGQIMAWIKSIDPTIADPSELAYPYQKDVNDPAILLVDRSTGIAWSHENGMFFPIQREYHAIGSGRDYALAALSLGRTAVGAVSTAKEFDNGTGGAIEAVPVTQTGVTK